MAYPTITYTITNGQTSDANKVMQNYNDIISGLTDGTKDINVNTAQVNAGMTSKHMTAPVAPSAGYVRTWFDSNNIQHWINASGVTGRVGGAGGGGNPVLWELIYEPAPLEAVEQGLKILEFNELDSQGIYAHLTVPEDYVTGRQIFLKGGKFAISATSGNILFRSTAYLIKPEDTELTTLANYRLATNTQLVASTANVIRNIGDLDLTDASGAINTTAVSAGDTILIFLQRSIASETAAATFSARLLRDSFYPVFS